MKSKATSLYDLDKIVVPDEMFDYSADENEIDARIAALSMEWAEEKPAETGKGTKGYYTILILKNIFQSTHVKQYV